MNLALVGNAVLRAAIQRNLVSFPSQIPAFMKGGDQQERIVQLYFVRGWEIKAICERYGLGKSSVRKLLSDWKARAVAAGYLQDIHPDALTFLATEMDVDPLEQEIAGRFAGEAVHPDWEIASLQRSWGTHSGATHLV